MPILRTQTLHVNFHLHLEKDRINSDYVQVFTVIHNEEYIHVNSFLIHNLPF
jgi:hypothetical protein